VWSLENWQRKYSAKIKIIAIYISEAHAEDEWPLSNTWKIYQHKTIEDRIEAAKNLHDEKQFKTLENIPIFVDSMDTKRFEAIYAAWPERGYVFLNGKVAEICNGTPNGTIEWRYVISDWLRKYFKE